MAKPIPLHFPAANFWRRVDMCDPSDCWEWTGKVHYRQEYGRVRYRGEEYNAHRVAYVLWHAEDVPPNLVIDHLCRNRRCCNPHHLQPVTSGENVRRGDVGKHNQQKKRPVINGITYCANWHPVEGANVMHCWDSRRQLHRISCRGCALMWNARYRNAA